MSDKIEVVNDLRGSDDPILEMKIIQLVKGVHRHGMRHDNTSDEQIERNLEMSILSALQKTVSVELRRPSALEESDFDFVYSLYEYSDCEINLDVEIRRW